MDNEHLLLVEEVTREGDRMSRFHIAHPGSDDRLCRTSVKLGRGLHVEPFTRGDGVRETWVALHRRVRGTRICKACIRAAEAGRFEQVPS